MIVCIDWSITRMCRGINVSLKVAGEYIKNIKDIFVYGNMCFNRTIQCLDISNKNTTLLHVILSIIFFCLFSESCQSFWMTLYGKAAAHNKTSVPSDICVTNCKTRHVVLHYNWDRRQFTVNGGRQISIHTVHSPLHAWTPFHIHLVIRFLHCCIFYWLWTKVLSVILYRFSVMFLFSPQCAIF